MKVSGSANRRERMRVLTFSTLYPSEARPRHGIFVETRLRHMIALGDVDARVVAPVPWFPSGWKGFGAYARFAATPRREQRHGVAISHPRYLMVPKIGMAMQPLALAIAGLRAVRRMRRDGFDCDVLDAHYFYPDGVAAAIMAKRLRKPLVVTARGSDLNLIADLPWARRRILAAARRCARIVCVSAALRDRAIAIGIEPESVEVLRNGVDLGLFTPQDRDDSLRALGLDRLPRPLLLAVGNLVPEKGLDLAVHALARIPQASLLIVGEGSEARALGRLAAELGVTSRLAIIAAMPQQRLALAYSAADLLVLPSLREGWPNVVLEAMACGTPVVAADVGGVREILSDPRTGRVLPQRSVEALVAGIADILRNAPSRDAVRGHAARFDWRTVVERHREILRLAAARSSSLFERKPQCATS